MINPRVEMVPFPGHRHDKNTAEFRCQICPSPPWHIHTSERFQIMYTVDDITAARPEIAAASNHVSHARPQPVAGLALGTLVETNTGWRPVDTLLPGDGVHTFDGGLRTLREVGHLFVAPDAAGMRHAGLVHVPGGAVQNCSDLTLLPDQPVMIEHPLVEAMFDCPSALVPARCLIGLNGIAPVWTRDVIRAIALVFDEEEIVWANSGMLLHCAGRGMEGADFFTALNEVDARMLALAMTQGTARVSLAA